jgi:hypothetical protein
MNISVLDKLEKGSILLDWSKHLNRVHLSPQNLSELVDKLDNWKSNKKCKEIILIKYKKLPVYITIHRSEFKRMADWLLNRLSKLEVYEECARIQKMYNKL